MVMKFEASWNDRKFHAATEQSEINKLMNSGFISGNETEWIKLTATAINKLKSSKPGTM